MSTIVLCAANKTALTSTRRYVFSHVKGLVAPGELQSPLASLTPLPGSRWLPRGSCVRFMSQGTAGGGSAAGRSRRAAAALSGAAAVTAAAAVAGLLANRKHFQRAEMATKVPQPAVGKEEEEVDVLERCRSFMSEPVTDVGVLQERKAEMSTRMEMLIMETQAEFCRALQEVDGGTFKVDQWRRKEGEGMKEVGSAVLALPFRKMFFPLWENAMEVWSQW